MNLALGENGFPALSMADQLGRGRLRVGLGADPDAAPSVLLRDDAGRARVFAAVAREPVILLNDESGSAVFRAPQQPAVQRP
jgi:hypothetical protein